MSDDSNGTGQALDIGARLQALKAKRGYLLPHHGLMAVTSEKLLAAYDAAYTALALDMRVLNVHDREFVWLAILIATDEALATHHIPKFQKAGEQRRGAGRHPEADSLGRRWEGLRLRRPSLARALAWVRHRSAYRDALASLARL